MKKETANKVIIAALFIVVIFALVSLLRPILFEIKNIGSNKDIVIPSSSGSEIIINNNSSLTLPSKIYGYKNIPIKIYFLNITEYTSDEELIFKVKDGGKGKTYKDRWEYTPKEANRFILEITVFDKNEILIDSVQTLIEIKASSEKEELSVLVLGDSTIEAAYETETILELSKNDSYPLSLVGTKTSFFNNPLNVHEGRAAWSSYHYANLSEIFYDTNPFYNYYSQGEFNFDFSYYMERNGFEELDCVVIQLGINDVFGYENDDDLRIAAENHLYYMEYMIKSIRSYDKDIKIVWNLILPPSSNEFRFESESEMQRAKRNTYLTNLEIIKSYSDIKNLYICPINAFIDSENNMADYVHPSKEGYEEIGTTLYGFLRAIN